MKKLLLSAFVAFAMLASTKTLAQQGFGTNSPDRSAAVDIVSSKRGLLIPRLDLSTTIIAAPVEAPAHGLLVYNKVATTGTNGVEPGFYYWERNNTTDETQWQGKWVRIVSSNTEKITKVEAGNNVQVNASTVGLTTTYKVSVEGGNNGQVLVTVPNPSYSSSDPTSEQFISQWVNASDFINGVNGITVTPVTNPTTGVIRNEISIGGALTDTTGTEIITDHAAGKTLAIQGLEVLTAFNPADDKIVIMDANGVLKSISPANLLSAKDLTLGDGLNFETGITGNDGVGAVLKATKIEIKDQSVTAEKLAAATNGSDVNKIPVANANGSVEYKDASTAIGKTLTTDNIIGVGVNAASATASSLDGAVLTPTYLKIKDDAITAAQIAPNAVTNSELAASAVTADKMQSKNTAAGTNAGLGTVPVSDGVGGVTYQTVASAVGENLTTDGKIVIGTTGNSQSLTDAVLVPTHLRIAPESITSADILNGSIESTDIKDGTITTTDIKAPGSTTDSNIGTPGQVLVTDASSGEVKWISQTDLPSNTKMDNGINTTVSGTGTTADPFEINVATASGTTLGVVKQSAATGEEITIAADGSLSVNEANVTVGSVAGSDVTGKLNDLTVTGIQGIPVSDADPTATNNMLVYNSSTNQWEPSTVAQAAGKALTGAGITITPGANATPGTATSLAAAVLADVTLGIANDAITNDKLADNAVKTENIENGAVGNLDLANGAVTADKMQSKDTATGNNVTGGMVPTADGSGGVTYQTVASAAGKTLTGAGITVTAGTAAGIGTSLAQSVLADVTLGIANDAITTDKIAAGAVSNSDIANGAVSANKMTATVTDATGAIVSTAPINTVATAGAGGIVEYKSITPDFLTDKKTLTTDGVIVIGADNTAIGVTAVNSLLADVKLNIGVDKITATHIATDAVGALELANNAVASENIIDGAITNVDIAPKAISPDKMTTYTTANGTATPAAEGTVATAGPNGTVSYQTPNSLVTVANGLNKTYTDIELGGTLKRATVITTGVNSDNDPTPANTLGVQGLIVPTAATSEIVYAEGTTGVLRKAVRSISQYIEASQVVSTITGYNDFVQEVNITAKIVSGDINVTLPAATATNKGQVVNVKITNTAEVADYVNIVVSTGPTTTTTLTYGALPYQSWIIKSNGSSWEVVGRN